MLDRRILVIDDDEGIRVTIEAALSDCEVATVDSAFAALPLLQAQEFDAVICDLMMPGMTGPELYACLDVDSCHRERFLFVTGGSVPMSVGSFIELAKLPVLKKPFSIASLRESVALILQVGLDSWPAKG